MTGDIPVPVNFKYMDVILKGCPRHDRTDAFRIRHPSMDPRHRAKIFAPFDALKGFDEAIASKNILYDPKPELSENEKEDLDRKIRILRTLTGNGRMGEKNIVTASVTCFIPCNDPENPAYSPGGTYKTITGTIWKIGKKNIMVDQTSIPLEDIVSIESEFITSQVYM